MTDSDKNIRKGNLDESDERVNFDVEIISDGTVIFQDVPREVIDILKSLYPDDPQTKKAVDALKSLINENED